MNKTETPDIQKMSVTHQAEADAALIERFKDIEEWEKAADRAHEPPEVKVKKLCTVCYKEYKNLNLHIHKTHKLVFVVCCKKYVKREEALVFDDTRPMCQECWT